MGSPLSRARGERVFLVVPDTVHFISFIPSPSGVVYSMEHVVAVLPLDPSQALPLPLLVA